MATVDADDGPPGSDAGEGGDDANVRLTPVTVLAGALGAGKTTLLRHILEKPHGYRVAVIQNEFSTEMGIESPLITDASGGRFNDIYELPNGCLCCSAKDGLVNMLDRLLEERARFDYVLVEATGVADPEAICEIFWVDAELGSRVYLDGVVTLVDVRNALAILGEEPGAGANGGDAADLGVEAESEKQIACADVLILNKLDLAGEGVLPRVRDRLEGMNPTATVLQSTYADVPLDRILGIRAFDRTRLAETLSSLGRDDAGHGNGHANAHGDAHGHGHGHGHTHEQGADCAVCAAPGPGSQDVIMAHKGIESFFLKGDEPEVVYDPALVRSWMAQVLWEGVAGGIYRCKGLFRGPSEEEEAGRDAGALSAYSLQGVGKVFEIEETACEPPSASKFLFVGRRLQPEVLRQGLRQCQRPADR